jgi:RES domain-containing protein
VRLIASVYRADHPAHTDLSRTTQESREHPGRFNTSRLGAVYLSLEPETAIKELRRNGGVPSECALFVVRTTLAQVLDLTEHGAMAAWNLTTEDLQADDVARCQEAAEAAAAAGNEAIICRPRRATGAASLCSPTGSATARVWRLCIKSS